MGIGLTLQQVQGWEGQYERMLRWYDRSRLAHAENRGDDEMDFVLVFFQQSLAFRDWIHEALPSVRTDLEELFRNNLELRICRDIANGFKHMKIGKKASVDRAFSIVFEYMPRDGREGDMVVLAGGHSFKLYELANSCVSIWQGFINYNGLQPSSVVHKWNTEKQPA
jgi:hypothetical protein